MKDPPRWRFPKRPAGDAGSEDDRSGGKLETPEGSSETSTDLQSVLERYDERVSRELEQKRQEDAEREVFRTEAIQVIRDLVRPALERIGERVSEHRHHFTIEERVDIQAQPAIAFSFTPYSPGVREPRASEISFRFRYPNQIVTSASFSGATSARHEPRSRATESLSEEWIETQVAGFLAEVLGPR